MASSLGYLSNRMMINNTSLEKDDKNKLYNIKEEQKYWRKYVTMHRRWR